MHGLFLSGFEVHRSSNSFSGGRVTSSYVAVSTISGRLSPLNGSEQMRTDQSTGVVTHRFSTASSSDVVVGDEIHRGGRKAKVKAVRITSSGYRKECACEEIN